MFKRVNAPIHYTCTRVTIKRIHPNLDCWIEEKYNWDFEEENIRVSIFVFSFFIQQKNHCFVGLFLVVKALAAEGKWTNKLKACAVSPMAMNI